MKALAMIHRLIFVGALVGLGSRCICSAWGSRDADRNGPGDIAKYDQT
jgi:hypothetical protein